VSQQINLFNPVFLKQKKIFAASAMAQALAVLVLGLLSFTAYNKFNLTQLSQQEAEARAQLTKRQEQFAAIAERYPARAKSPALAAELAAAEARLSALKSVAGVLDRGVVGNTTGFSSYFRALAQPRVNGLWLTGFTLNGAADELTIEGRALQAELVPQFIARLAREPQFQGKTFGALDIGEAPVKPEAGKAAPGAPAFLEFTLRSAPAKEARP